MLRTITRRYYFIFFLIGLFLHFGLKGAVAADTIIDNLDSANVSSVGNWQESSGQFEWAGSSFWARDGATFSFHFEPTETGPHQVLEWHSLWSSRSDSVLMRLVHDGSGATLAEWPNVNQKIGGNTWNPLPGEFNLTAGETYTVTIVADPGPSSTSADAVMFRPVTDDIIIDNLDSANVSSVGNWQESSGQFEWNGSSFWARSDATIVPTFSFHFEPTETRPHQVLEWHSLWSSRSDSVLMRLVHDGSGTTLAEWPAVNQKIGGNTWNPLPGEFNLTAGETYTVTIVADPGPSSTSADAVMFRPVTGNSPPVAAFSGTPTSGTAPLTVQFTDQSTGATGWEWDFDNNGTVDSTNQSPSHQYTAADSYTVKLTVTNTVGSDDEIKVGYITVTEPQQPIAAFTGTPTSGTAPLTVQFIDQSTGATSWEWDFDNDGIVDSTNQSPSHQYTAADTYTVKLTVTNTIGSDDEIKVGYITVNEPQQPPVAAFSGTPTSGTAPLTVQFADQSTGATSWEWDFDNDGTVDSTSQSPSHQYTAADTYTVKLMVTNTIGSDDEIKVGYITVNEPQQPPVAAFTGTPTSGNAPLTVQFTDQSTGATSWEWDFDNDGTVDSTSQSPSHQYTATGTYTVKLTAINDAGSDDEVKPSFITVTGSSQTVQHVYAIPLYEVNYYYFQKALLEIGATQINQEDWTYTNVQGQDFSIHIVQDDPVRTREILQCDGCEIVMAGHANYGSAHGPSSNAKNAAGRLYGVLYVDDPWLVKMSSPFYDGSVSGIRNHYDPAWQPIYQNGDSAIMPFGFFDLSGESPPYNYEIPYRRGSTCYSTGIERMLPESGATAWFDPFCGEPDPTDPNDWQYFITSEVTHKEGDWITGAMSGDYGSNYYYIPQGSGDNKVTWEDRILKAGVYSLYGWWIGSSANTANAAYTVIQPDGSEIALFENVDQTSGGAWIKIGDFSISNPGPFGVVLTDAAGSPGNVIADAIRIVGPNEIANEIEANFRSTTLRFGPAPLTVRFGRQHTGEVTQYEWDFDSDGTVDSTSTSPTYTYLNSGSYDVTLTVRDANGNEDSSTFTNYIDVGVTPAPVYAEFSNSSPTGNYEYPLPAEVDFTDRSVTSGGTIVNWQWDLDGNGTIDSFEQNPTYTYTTPGIYTVSLTVTDDMGNSDTKIKEKYVLALDYYNIIDNSASPSYHYSTRTMLRRNGSADVTAYQLGYKRLFIHSCQGRYYLEQYPHGTVFYATITYAGPQGQIWLKGVLQGKSDYQIWQDLQAILPVFDYYVFPD